MKIEYNWNVSGMILKCAQKCITLIGKVINMRKSM